MIDGEIVCMGELLWDSMPAGLFMGGAPFNVAHDLHRLGTPARIISRVGKDILGDEIVRRVKGDGMSSSLIQRDAELPTGFVEVNLDNAGAPHYRIVEPAAWDAITVDETLIGVVRNAGALVCGSLACRNARSRETIMNLCDVARIKVFDVNLRPRAESPEVVEELLRKADIVKVNAGELETLRKWFSIPNGERAGAEGLAVRFGCAMVCLSKGEEGGSLWHDGRWTSHPGYRANVENSVGAGDALLAGLLDSFRLGKSDEEALDFANLLGAFVVTKREAAPNFDQADLHSFKAGPDF